jgi:D-alanyl-lipoteichoic acid acyltransferase DltB (MBOAT superfamily)
MLFNSIDFLIFFPAVFILYWFVFSKSLSVQNALIVLASYVFYGWWDWRFLTLIVFSTVLDFTIAKWIERYESQKVKKTLLIISLVSNLGLLGFFKYFNFFTESFADAFNLMGIEVDMFTLNVILPVGISFYTFQTLSYTIDVYRGKMKPSKDIIAFSAFVCFFPQLVAGPIERATHLLPQFTQKRIFRYDLALDGMRQILWGFFKKLVIADGCAHYVNIIFNGYETLSSSTLILGAVFFAFQIYGDFSGYSDIAIGLSRLFGFDLKQNFAFPYFSRDMAEFWRRWHISLSTWFRDYVYIPLGGSKVSLFKVVRNTFIIFIVSGFWHGANWTFIVWGALNALYFLPLLLSKRNRKNLGVVAENSFFPSLKECLKMSWTFALTCMAWVFFRADSIGEAFHYIEGMFHTSILTIPNVGDGFGIFVPLALIVFFLLVEWLGRRKMYGLQIVELVHNAFVRRSAYIIIIALIGVYSATKESPFIYFQF